VLGQAVLLLLRRWVRLKNACPFSFGLVKGDIAGGHNKITKLAAVDTASSFRNNLIFFSERCCSFIV